MEDWVWSASEKRRAASYMQRFTDLAGSKFPEVSDYDSLYQWSLDSPSDFWGLLAEYVSIKWISPPERVFIPPKSGGMLGGEWFGGATMNFAHNMLPAFDDKREIIVGYAESGTRQSYDGAKLCNDVARTAQALRKMGVSKGDRVAGVLANVPEALVAMLATASIGAIWSSCSPDFGEGGIIDRLKQVEPKCLFFTESYSYGGRCHSFRETVESCLEVLPSVLCSVSVNIQGLNDQAELAKNTAMLSWGDFLASSGFSDSDAEPLDIDFEPVDFSHPLYIMFSSGTTGVPKCIVHGTGGTLLQHKKELMLHCDLQPSDRLLYFTTCGWMMWNWMASGLSTGATLAVFEGSLNFPRADVLWEFIANEGVTVLGTSPKYLSYCINNKVKPNQIEGTASLRTILSTGAPLLPEHFDWVYEQFPQIHLASISGGTDIISCFMLGNPIKPVHRGQIQGAGLGMAVEAWGEHAGISVKDQKGELICTKPFVSMPVGFWQDPQGVKFREAYFDYYPDREVWRHGDFIEIDSNTGGIVVYGRSDATLNPGGVRIGTAELYRQVESMDEIADSIAVGRNTADGDVEVILFVKLSEGTTWNDVLVSSIKKHIRQQLTPRHVPAAILVVNDIPYTRSGKKVELAVTRAIHGEEIVNLTAIANPESLDQFVNIEWDH